MYHACMCPPKYFSTRYIPNWCCECILQAEFNSMHFEKCEKFQCNISWICECLNISESETRTKIMERLFCIWHAFQFFAISCFWLFSCTFFTTTSIWHHSIWLNRYVFCLKLRLFGHISLKEHNHLVYFIMNYNIL